MTILRRYLIVAIWLALPVLFIFLLFNRPPAAFADSVKFGMDINSIDVQESSGIKPDYGMFWIGSWTLSSGWGGPDKLLETAVKKGVSPVIQFYYWGDDISINCVENGCWSSLHNTWKNKQNWQTLAVQLTDHLNKKMRGKQAVIILETEFNKGNITNYEPFDDYLAEKARFIKSKYPAAKVVVGFGNWGSSDWSNFDESVGASDMVSIQALRGSTHNNIESYRSVADSTLTAARMLKSIFGKPILISDVALSSYPTWSHEKHQTDALRDFFANLDSFKAQGVAGLIYRTYKDNPSANTANYYGEGERYWGLAKADGSPKPAWFVWKDGIKAERSVSVRKTNTPPPAPEPETQPEEQQEQKQQTMRVNFELSPNINKWWAEVWMGNNPGPVWVDMRIENGQWLKMDKTNWGSWAKNMYIEPGSNVTFRVINTQNNETILTREYNWLQ
ncbi:MAG: hypothetical protein HYS87_00550 [Candidatus Colwellbacteria bacterium]|nr:hypothetical protein [Candidatus Colwellbacteria bacterium]